LVTAPGVFTVIQSWVRHPPYFVGCVVGGTVFAGGTYGGNVQVVVAALVALITIRPNLGIDIKNKTKIVNKIKPRISCLIANNSLKFRIAKGRGIVKGFRRLAK
jgi:hypothetical protein